MGCVRVNATAVADTEIDGVTVTVTVTITVGSDADLDMVSGHCCCCPLGLAQRPCSIFQRPCQQGRHCTCFIINAHNVHVQPHGQPLHPLEVQQQRLPTPWRGTQVDKSTASKNNTHSIQTDPSQRLLCCVVNHRFIMAEILCDILDLCDLLLCCSLCSCYHVTLINYYVVHSVPVIMSP